MSRTRRSKAARLRVKSASWGPKGGFIKKEDAPRRKGGVDEEDGAEALLRLRLSCKGESPVGHNDAKAKYLALQDEALEALLEPRAEAARESAGAKAADEERGGGECGGQGSSSSPRCGRSHQSVPGCHDQSQHVHRISSA